MPKISQFLANFFKNFHKSITAESHKMTYRHISRGRRIFFDTIIFDTRINCFNNLSCMFNPIMRWGGSKYMNCFKFPILCSILCKTVVKVEKTANYPEIIVFCGIVHAYLTLRWVGVGVGVGAGVKTWLDQFQTSFIAFLAKKECILIPNFSNLNKNSESCVIESVWFVGLPQRCPQIVPQNFSFSAQNLSKTLYNSWKKWKKWNLAWNQWFFAKKMAKCEISILDWFMIEFSLS